MPRSPQPYQPYLTTQVQNLARYATLIDTGYTLNLTVAIAEFEYSKLAPDVQQILVEAAYQGR